MLLSLGLAAIALLTHWLVGRMVMRLARSRYMAESTALRLRSLLRLTLFLLFALLALKASGAIDELWAIVSATLAALAVAFVATWSLLSNLTSALILLTFRPFRVGDQIEILEGDKVLVSGKVLDLNLIFTTLVDGDVASRIPNNLLLQRVVRVTREGLAPNPSEDMTTPFF